MKWIKILLPIFGFGWSHALRAQPSEISLSLDTSFLDSRSEQFFLPETKFGLGVAMTSDRLRGSLELQGVMSRTIAEHESLTWTLKQADFDFIGQSWSLGGGRMSLRYAGLFLHKASSDWLGSSPQGDGARLTWRGSTQSSQLALLILAPEGLGASAAWCPSLVCFSALTSWQLQKTVLMPVAVPQAGVDWGARQTEEWFLELALHAQGPALRALGAFQGSQRGPYRLMAGDRVGDKDASMPDSHAAYRAVAQFDGLFFEHDAQMYWWSLAVGGRASPRLYEGRDEADFLRQGSGGSLFISPAIVLNEHDSKLQLGVLWIHSKDPNELWFGQREPSGLRTLSRERFGVWSSFQAKL